MAESFKNYITKVNTNSDTAVVIVPSGYSNGNTTNIRDAGSVAQIHSLYISQYISNKYEGIKRYNPKNFNAFNLFIRDTTSQNSEKIYIVYDGRIVPGSPFFIEKNITLEPTQELCIECPQDSKDYDMSNTSNQPIELNNNGAYLHITASAVLFPDANL